MKYSYRTRGACSQVINFDITDGKVSDVSFLGGCDGNLKAISRLVEGHDAKEIAGILKGVTCGYKNTSCGDQFAQAIEAALAQQAQ